MVARRLDALDDAVGRACVDRHPGPDLLDRLMVRRVDRELRRAADPRQPRARCERDRMARLVARVGLLVGQGPRHLVGDVLDQGAAEHHVEQLLAAADAEHRHVARQRGAGGGQLEFRAPVLGRNRGVARIGAEVDRVDVKGAAGNDQAVEPLEERAGVLRLVRQQHRQATAAHHRLAVVLANRVPGPAGIAARRLAIERQSDDRPAGHGADL